MFQVVEPINHIVLNALELEFQDPRLVDSSGQEIRVNELVLNAETERAEFKFLSVLQPGLYNLQLTFKGVITEKLQGFYYSKYVKYKIYKCCQQLLNTNLSFSQC